MATENEIKWYILMVPMTIAGMKESSRDVCAKCPMSKDFAKQDNRPGQHS